jgi:hypothetical protein
MSEANETTEGTESAEGSRQTRFSPWRKYRYTLWREFPVMNWLTGDEMNGDSYLMVVGLNPSTADETKDDPTIRKCVGFATRWGYGALCMTNLFAWRDTKPAKMKKAVEPIGEENDHHLERVAKGAGMVLAAWGRHGSYLNRGNMVQRLLARNGVTLHCLRENGDGSPMHPLYVPYETNPIPYSTPSSVPSVVQSA